MVFVWAAKREMTIDEPARINRSLRLAMAMAAAVARSQLSSARRPARAPRSLAGPHRSRGGPAAAREQIAASGYSH